MPPSSVPLSQWYYIPAPPMFPFHPLTPHPILYPLLKKNALPPNALLAWYRLEDMDLGGELEETMVWKKRDGDEKD